jgi:hypothetical protein
MSGSCFRVWKGVSILLITILLMYIYTACWLNNHVVQLCPFGVVVIVPGCLEHLQWADDFMFWCYLISILPSGLYAYSYDENLIRRIGEDLGWPWSLKKHFPFTYLGFEWDLDNKTVTIGKAKCTKYIDRLKPWRQNACFMNLKVQKLIGTLNHCSVVLVEGRSHLPSLYHFVGTFKDTENAFVMHTATCCAINDTAWWHVQLSKP